MLLQTRELSESQTVFPLILKGFIFHQLLEDQIYMNMVIRLEWPKAASGIRQRLLQSPQLGEHLAQGFCGLLDLLYTTYSIFCNYLIILQVI